MKNARIRYVGRNERFDNAYATILSNPPDPDCREIDISFCVVLSMREFALNGFLWDVLNLYGVYRFYWDANHYRLTGKIRYDDEGAAINAAWAMLANFVPQEPVKLEIDDTIGIRTDNPDYQKAILDAIEKFNAQK